MRVKRWLALVLIGVLLITTGFSLLINFHLFTWIEKALLGLLGTYPSGTVPLRLLDGSALLLAGLAFFAVGLRNMVRSIVMTLLPEGAENLADRIYHQRQLERGPKVVVIGGGTGLATLLRGLKDLTSNITAIVTVADDGGSSGRIRSEMGILPPGDIRMCLAALADTEPLMEKLFQYRFKENHNGLAGHTFGNLFIATMTEITGDFEQAVKESSKVLAVRGQVLPSTLQDVVLCAEMSDGEVISGESDISRAGKKVQRVFLKPGDAMPLPEAVAAIKSADAVIIGPGSLYTSLIPNLLVKGISEALAHTAALRIYVCNVMTQPGETDGYTASDHLKAILEHTGEHVVDAVVVHNGEIPAESAQKYREQGQYSVVADTDSLQSLDVVPVAAPLVCTTDLVRHDSKRLAQTILDLINRRAKPKSLVWREFYLAEARRRK
jgi:uncharacterized cofD-like protein